jgi:hypothetical protein
METLIGVCFWSLWFTVIFTGMSVVDAVKKVKGGLK